MIFSKLLSGVAVTAALTLTFIIPEAAAQNGVFAKKKTEKSKTRKELIRENYRMRCVIDSLLQEVEAFKDTAYVDETISERTSRNFSLLDGVAPETYSQEVTDSLLSIWSATSEK